MTYRLESCDFGFLLLVIKSILHVVDCNPSSSTTNLGDLRDTLVRAVPSTEIQDCGPIVGEVF